MNNLEAIKGVGRTTAEKLQTIGGIDTVEELAAANYMAVAKATGLPGKIVQRLISAAKSSVASGPSEEVLEAADAEGRPIEPVVEEKLPVEEKVAVGIVAESAKFPSLIRKEIVSRAMQTPPIRARVIKNIITQLFD